MINQRETSFRSWFYIFRWIYTDSSSFLAKDSVNLPECRKTRKIQFTTLIWLDTDVNNPETVIPQFKSPEMIHPFSSTSLQLHETLLGKKTMVIGKCGCERWWKWINDHDSYGTVDSWLFPMTGQRFSMLMSCKWCEIHRQPAANQKVKYWKSFYQQNRFLPTFHSISSISFDRCQPMFFFSVANFNLKMFSPSTNHHKLKWDIDFVSGFYLVAKNRRSR